MKFKQYEAIVFDPKYDQYRESYPLGRKEVVYFLGNIPNVTGHCLVVKYSGEVIAMVHPEDFRKATEEEL